MERESSHYGLCQQICSSDGALLGLLIPPNQVSAENYTLICDFYSRIVLLDCLFSSSYLDKNRLNSCNSCARVTKCTEQCQKLLFVGFYPQVFLTDFNLYTEKTEALTLNKHVNRFPISVLG